MKLKKIILLHICELTHIISVCVCVCVCVRARARARAHTHTHTHTHTDNIRFFMLHFYCTGLKEIGSDPRAQIRLRQILNH